METYIVPDEQKKIYLDAIPEEFHEGVLNDEIILIGVVDDEGSIRGVLATDITMATWRIVYIIVDEDYRRQGIGASMLLYLDVAAMGLLAENVTVTLIQKPGEDSTLDVFFENMLCPISDSSDLYRVRLGDLKKKLPKNMTPVKGTKIVPLNQVSGRLYNEFRNSITRRANSDLNNEVIDNKKVLYIDPRNRDYFDEEFSYLYLNAQNQPRGGIFCSTEDDGISIDYVCILEEGASSKKAFIRMLVEAGRKAENKYGPDVMIYVNTATEISKQLFLKVTGGAEELYARIVERTVQ